MTTIRNVKTDHGVGEHGRRFYFTESVTDVTSDPVRLPITPSLVLVHVTPNSGASALVQFTLSTNEAIESDSAQWIDWPLGAVTEETLDAAEGAITALRLVSTGTTTWEISI